MKSINAARHLIRKKNLRLSEEQESENFSNILGDLGISKQQFHTLFDHLPQGIALNKLVFNNDGKPIDFIQIISNHNFDEINPFQSKVFWSTSTSSMKKRDTSINWIQIYGEVALTGLPKILEAYCRPKKRWYKIFTYCPKKSYCFSLFFDITAEKKAAEQKNTERKEAKEALISSEKRFRKLYETTQDGIMARDMQGNMLHCNQAYAKMLGYTKKELKTLSVEQLLPEKWLDQRQKVIKKVLETGRSIVFEREYKRKDESTFPASVRTWRLTNGKGKAIGVWSIVRDITEQKEYERSLEKQADDLAKIIEERTKQLKDSERLVVIGQTAGMVGHDLRNPLQTLVGELFLAKNEVDLLEDTEARSNMQESIRVIEEQVSYMDKIVSDLQAFVQPVRIEKKIINLQELVSNILSTITIPSNVKTQTQIQGKIPQIQADGQLLRRVLINLITNAIQAMPYGGKLQLAADVNSEQVQITVRDTGVGIPERIKSQIFTPLFTTKPRGQGFGLAVCKRVIEAHGGTITFESTEGKGAEFTINIPVH